MIAVPLEGAAPRRRRVAAVALSVLAMGALVAVVLVTQPPADEGQRLTAEPADEKRVHSHHAPSPPPFPFATSAYIFDGMASRRCIEMLISECPQTHAFQVEWFGTWKKCCPTPTPPGTCYHSDKCFAECADGFGELARSSPHRPNVEHKNLSLAAAPPAVHRASRLFVLGAHDLR